MYATGTLVTDGTYTAYRPKLEALVDIDNGIRGTNLGRTVYIGENGTAYTLPAIVNFSNGTSKG